MAVKSIALNKIIFSEVALRETKDEAVQAMKEDILKRGLLNLMTVSDNGDGTYTIIDGGHRTKALQELAEEGKWTPEQEFQIKEKMSDVAILKDQLSGNFNRTGTTNKEAIRAMHRIATETDLTMQEIADEAGLTLAYVQKLFKTLRLPDSVQDAVAENKITVTNFIALSDLAGKVDEDELIEEWVVKAGEETAKDFALSVQEEIDRIKEEAKGGERKAPEFVVKKKLISKDELEALLVKAEADFIANSNPTNEAIMNLMKTIWSIDEASVAEQKAAWDKKESDKEAKKAARKAERETAKREEMIKSLEADGHVVTKA